MKSDKTIKKKKTIDEKVELFKDFFKNGGTQIKSNTIYKGEYIGEFLRSIRYDLNKDGFNSKKYSLENIEELEKLGLLDNYHETTIEQKIYRFNYFCKNYSKLWYYATKSNRFDGLNEKETYYLNSIEDEKEREKIKKQLELVKKDYRYLVERKSRGKLKSEDIEKIRASGIGGVFGYKDELIELAKQNGLSVEKVYKIEMLYGGIEKFQNDLIHGELLKSMEEKEKKDYVLYFDIASPDLCMRENPIIKLSKDVLNLEELPFIVDSSKLNVESLFKKSNLSSIEEEIIKYYYGFYDGKKYNFSEISIKLNISRQRIQQIKAEIINKFRSYHFINEFLKIILNIDEETKKKFLTMYYSKIGIFYNNDPLDMLDNDKEELINLVKNGIIKKDNSEVKDKLIEDLGLTERSYNSLKKIGVNSLFEICEMTQDELICQSGIGKNCFFEILNTVHFYGLFLKDEKSPDIYEKEIDDIDSHLLRLIENIGDSYKKMSKDNKKYISLKNKLISILNKELSEKDVIKIKMLVQREKEFLSKIGLLDIFLSKISEKRYEEVECFGE